MNPGMGQSANNGGAHSRPGPRPDPSAVAACVGPLNLKFYVDGNGLNMRQPIINCATQAVVPKSLQACLRNLAHRPTLARHPAQRRIYNSMKLKYDGI